MMSNLDPTDPASEQIHVDEDWKQKVARERAEAERRMAEAAAAGEAAGMPPADFTTLVSMLATQAVISMGQVPNPITGQIEPRPDEARHFIDLLGMLEEKTRRNLTGHEANLINNVLHELRMAFVHAGQQPGAATAQPPDEPGAESKIILP
ncbi:MAG: DUF1844 domain-containing protein [Pirellulales bacterium]|nr:DUF1844 domain-containing protein [Pirellulales bacterium]